MSVLQVLSSDVVMHSLDCPLTVTTCNKDLYHVPGIESLHIHELGADPYWPAVTLNSQNMDMHRDRSKGRVTVAKANLVCARPHLMTGFCAAC